MPLILPLVLGKILSKDSLNLAADFSCSQAYRYEDFLAQFDTNVFGTIKVTKALLPHFRQRRAGTMVFIGSLSGWIGHPGVAAYAGSKFALEGESDSIQPKLYAKDSWN
jgi:NAD(P)-dependent dehydrogenase (short-subunit alcohol dehydrogenase family)